MAQLRRLFVRPSHGRISKAKRKARRFERLWVLLGKSCAYCRKDLPFHQVTRDHVVPQSGGGGNGKNVVPCCLRCNSDKGSRDVWEWLRSRYGNAEAKFVMSRLWEAVARSIRSH